MPLLVIPYLSGKVFIFGNRKLERPINIACVGVHMNLILNYVIKN